LLCSWAKLENCECIANLCISWYYYVYVCSATHKRIAFYFDVVLKHFCWEGGGRVLRVHSLVELRSKSGIVWQYYLGLLHSLAKRFVSFFKRIWREKKSDGKQDVKTLPLLSFRFSTLPPQNLLHFCFSLSLSVFVINFLSVFLPFFICLSHSSFGCICPLFFFFLHSQTNMSYCYIYTYVCFVACPAQGDQIGRIFAHWGIVYFGHFFWKL
jgi:hypothetical protein